VSPAPSRGPGISQAANARRLGAWASLALAVAFLILGIGGIRGWIPRDLGQAALLCFFASLFSCLWFGMLARRQALEDREREMSGIIIVTIAAQLGKQDDATLERIALQGGPAGEAAAMILQGRAEKRNRPGPASSG
jgi:hypothetical protein